MVKAEGNKKETVVLDSEQVAIRATGIANETLGFYATATSDQYKVEDSRVKGSGIVEIFIDWWCGRDSSHYDKYQTLEFKDGTLVNVSSKCGGNWYQYYPDEKFISFGTYMTDNGNAQWHMVRGIISPNEQNIEETTRVQVHTDLQAIYTPGFENGFEGFQLELVKLHQYLPLSNEDVAKFLPNRRFITLEDLLASAINPYQSGQRYRERVPEIHRIDDFPKFHYADVGPHSGFFVTTLDYDHDVILGFSHPLKDNPNGWLVFVRFSKGETGTGRALLVELDRENVKVEDVDGVPTIKVQASVDGERFELAIPEAKGGWKEKSEETEKRATDRRTDNKGREWFWVPINAEELTKSIKNGYYFFSDMVNGVVEAYHSKYYK